MPNRLRMRSKGATTERSCRRALPPSSSLPAAAQAKFVKAIWGPYELPAGNAACPGAYNCSPFPVYRELGVEVVQFQIHWDEVAPTRPANPRDPNDPAYDWGAIDSVRRRRAQGYGIELAAMLHRAPGWANGGRSPIWAPKSPKDFADFAYAASRPLPRNPPVDDLGRAEPQGKLPAR